MDNYIEFKEQKKKEFDLGYGMVFVSTEDKMDDFLSK